MSRLIFLPSVILIVRSNLKLDLLDYTSTLLTISKTVVPMQKIAEAEAKGLLQMPAQAWVLSQLLEVGKQPNPKIECMHLAPNMCFWARRNARMKKRLLCKVIVPNRCSSCS